MLLKKKVAWLAVTENWLCLRLGSYAMPGAMLELKFAAGFLLELWPSRCFINIS